MSPETPAPPIEEEVKTATLQPVQDGDRISSIDLLRGVALLGIALLNVPTGLPDASFGNPNIAGGSTGINLIVFLARWILVEGKMRGLFSIMFGAGVFLFVRRLEARGAGILAAELYYRRILWLAVFGVIHAYLIWDGDILYSYAVSGLLLFPLLRWKPKFLLLVAALLIGIGTARPIWTAVERTQLKADALKANQAKKAGKQLTDEQKKAIADWQRFMEGVSPSKKDLKKEADKFSGSYFHVVKERAPGVRRWHSGPLYLWDFDAFPMMLIGIAMLQLGILSGERTNRFYVVMMLVTYGIGLPLSIIMVFRAWGHGFQIDQDVFMWTLYQPARVFGTLGNLCLLILFFKSGWLPKLQAALSAVGKTAFSNYILHSLVYGFAFYGYGFHLFGRLELYQLYYIVAGMWVFSLVASPLWLRAYRYGPLEWCWRSLTYWQRQPMLREQTT